MSLTQKIFTSEEKLVEHIKTHNPTFYFSSKTSTVIPYEKIEQYLKEDTVLGDLSSLPRKLEINKSGNLSIRGAVSWKEARDFLRPKGFNIMTSPTEELALILAGVATSCTGERCFSFGNLRSQVVSVKYLNYKGEEKTLHSQNKLKTSSTYGKDFKKYEGFKNAPFPRLETETDLMIGTEGQLGVITEVELKIIKDEPLTHLFILIPKWEVSLDLHLEVLNAIQKFRNDVYLCEFVDSNSFNYLKKEERPNQGFDAIFFEIKKERFDYFYEKFLTKIPKLNQGNIFELTETKFHHLRASIPRAVFEENNKMGVVKMGTDIQVKPENFEALMKMYKDLAKSGIQYNLFGHFGDAHLHFNFMPTTTKEVDTCQSLLDKLYQDILPLTPSPFAEHGIGLIKQKYIKSFWTKTQTDTFTDLKSTYDPYNQFFPSGFMRIKL